MRLFSTCPKRLFTTFFAFLIFAVSISAQALTEDERIFDIAGLFSQKEIDSLNSQISAVEQKAGVYISVMTLDDVGSNKSDRTVADYTDVFFEEKFGINSDGIILLINDDPSSRYDYITTRGTANSVFNDETLDKIFDRLYVFLANGDYYGAASNFISLVEEVYDGYLIEYDSYQNEYGIQPNAQTYSGAYSGYDYNDNRQMRTSAIAGAVVSAIVSLIIVIGVNARYKIRPQQGSQDYLKQSSVHYAQKSDVFLRRYVTKVKISSDNNNRPGGFGGGSFHRSSGGGMHGGMGRHR